MDADKRRDETWVHRWY